MSSRQCPQCGKRYPSSYRQCPYCSGQVRRRQSRPVSRADQILTILRQYKYQIIGGGWVLFFSIAVIGFLFTRCSDPASKPPDDTVDQTPVQTVPVAPLPLAISQSAATVTVGETVTLTVSGGFDTLIWTASDETVVSIANGRVTGKAAGSAVVTASTGIESVSCEITVEEPVPVSKFDLALNHTDFTLPAGDPPVQMKVRIKGTRDPYEGEVVWASQDVTVATVSEDGLVERVGRGTTTITATADGQTLECIVRVR